MIRFVHRVPLLAAIAVAALSTAAAAEPRTFTIDRPHSAVEFSVRHFFSKTPGRFDRFAGTIQYDEKNLAASSVNVEIETASINTGNEKRDGHLRTGDFFLADSFPKLTFVSRKVVPGQGNKFKIEGDLTIRGVTRPVVLDAEMVGQGPVTMGGRAMGVIAGFEATTRVNRKDYGLLWNRPLDHGGFMLGDDVDITLRVEAKHSEGTAGK